MLGHILRSTKHLLIEPPPQALDVVYPFYSVYCAFLRVCSTCVIFSRRSSLCLPDPKNVHHNLLSRQTERQGNFCQAVILHLRLL